MAFSYVIIGKKLDKMFCSCLFCFPKNHCEFLPDDLLVKILCSRRLTPLPTSVQNISFNQI